jgi:excisionase family DNA binding protein
VGYVVYLIIRNTIYSVIGGSKVKTTEKMIDVSQAANRLGVSIATVYRMMEDGRLGGVRMKGIGSMKCSCKVSVDSIELLEKNSRVLSLYEEEKLQQMKLFAI